MSLLAPSSYLGPIEQYVHYANNKEIIIEKYEHFIKQSYRNRCVIYGANGALKLVIPLVSLKRDKTLMKDVKICNDTPWRAQHWKSLASAYRSSPYFEYYEQEFEKIYLQEYTNLFDFCDDLRKLIIKSLNLDCSISYTEEFVLNQEIKDIRPTLHPRLGTSFEPDRYIQVFENKKGFLPNLSILDLLFNEGPSAKTYLINHKDKV